MVIEQLVAQEFNQLCNPVMTIAIVIAKVGFVTWGPGIEVNHNGTIPIFLLQFSAQGSRHMKNESMTMRRVCGWKNLSLWQEERCVYS